MSLLTIRQKFNPTKIGGCKLWLDASSLVLDGVADGGAVTTWRDLSGNGNSPTQATAGNKPALQTSELNGRPVVRFDGTSDYLSGNISLQDVTVIAVAKQSSPAVAGHQGLVQLSVAPNRVNLYTRRNATGNFLSTWNSTDAWDESDLSLTQDAPYVLSYVIDETTSVSIFANGATRLDAASLTYNFAAITTLYVGSADSGSSQWFTGDLAELIIYNRPLVPTERARVERHLGNKYGIALS